MTAGDEEQQLEEVNIDDEKAELESIIAEISNKLDERKHSRDQNEDPNFERNKPKGKMDSTVKKNSAFVKKLSTIKESQRDALEKEFAGLNFGRYVAEAATAIADGKYKSSDIDAVVSLSVKIHLRYEDFMESLFGAYKKKFTLSKIADDPNRHKNDLKIICELTAQGVFMDKQGLGLIHHELKALLESDKDKFEHIQSVLGILKSLGEDIAGTIPVRVRELCEKFEISIPLISLFDLKKMNHFENLFVSYFDGLNSHLKTQFDKLKKMEKTNRHIYQQRGEIHEERRSALLEQQAKVESLKQNAISFGQLLNHEVVHLPEDSPEDKEMSIDIYHPERGMESCDMEDCWEDEDQRLFYTSLPDLKSLVPMNAWKDSEKERGGKHDPKKIDRTNKGNRKADQDLQEEIEQGLSELYGDDDDGDDNHIDETDAEVDPNQLTAKEEFDIFMKSLMTIYNRELVDIAAQEFLLNLNTPVNRKRLPREIWKVDRRRIDLLPFFTRLAASLKDCAPRVADELAQYLLKDFRYHLRKKDQIHFEVKIKNARYIGEATKFGLISRSEATTCFRILVLDFSIGAIEMICGLLESAGRFLFRSPDSHQKTKLLLEQLKRKKQTKNLDQRLLAQLDNAIYCCNPPTGVAREVEKRPSIKEYIRILLYGELTKKTVEFVLKQYRKLDWSDPDISEYAIKCMSRGYMIKFSVVHCAASVLAGLSTHHEGEAIEVVDNILEDIKATMEYPDPRYNQRRLVQAKYLGELYNYKMVDSNVIFSTLYSFITFGVPPDPLNMTSPLDPPENLIRLRLASILLETCGCFFDKGTAKRKLDIYLQYLMRYWLVKRELYAIHEQTFPLGMDHLVRDCVEALRPKLKIPYTLDEVCATIDNIESEAMEKLEQMGYNNQAQDGPQGLGAIVEGDEDSQDERDESESVTDTDTQTEAEMETSGKQQPSKYEQCQEDDDFVKEFENLMKSDDLPLASKSTDLTVPLNAKKALDPNEKEDGKVVFALVTRKGNKTDVKALHVDQDSRLAQGLEAAARERIKAAEEMKTLTLSLAENQADEEATAEAIGMSKIPSENRNHERSKKYSHPKAPPNADALFTIGGRRR